MVKISNFLPHTADAVWSRWDSWSSCSVSCGEGIITRTRVCMFGHYGEGSCKGNTSMTSACNITCMGGVPILPGEILHFRNNFKV